MISIEDFAKIELRMGYIKAAERVPDTDKLLKLSVDFGLKPSTARVEGSPDHPTEQNGVGGGRDVRQVVSGIAEYFEDPEALTGTTCPFVTNLEPRTIRGLESQAMIVAVHTEAGAFSVLEATGTDVPAGTRLN